MGIPLLKTKSILMYKSNCDMLFGVFLMVFKKIILGGKAQTQNITLTKRMPIFGTSAVANPKNGHSCSLFQRFMSFVIIIKTIHNLQY
jgi:hypothetical protein